MIQFPETAQREWRIVADAAHAEEAVRQRLERDTRVEQEVERLRVRHEAQQVFQAELDADGAPALEMVTLGTYLANPAQAPSDLIEGVMKDNGLTLVVGPSGSGKSTLALQMLHSLHTGEDWLGQPAKPVSGGIGILSYDMDASLVLDWMSGFPNMDPTKVSVVNAYKRGNPVGVKDMRAQIAAAWRAMNVEVVVLDSFSASFFGHDQNDSAATMAHYRDMKLFALTEVGAKVLVVIAHSSPSTPQKIRGSTVHTDVADSIVTVVPEGPQMIRKVEMVKYRAGRGQVQMDPVLITAPDSVTHLVDLDVGEMNMKGMKLPASVAASAAFGAAAPINAPEADSDSDEDEDDL